MKDQQRLEYDYIIAGGGCAGLSLVFHLINDPSLKSKRILILDKEKKISNDRTWCFWEKESGPFEEIVSHKWKTLEFHGANFSKQFDLNTYVYKMIKGNEFYDFVNARIEKSENVTIKYESIQSMYSEGENGIVETDKGTYSAEYIFNSTSLFYPEMNESNSLLQHFEGWFIRTKTPVFNENVGTLMDFRFDQKRGATFMYVLPTKSDEALIEFTLFSKKVLERDAYKIELEKYIQESLKITDYEIIHKESGVIPMSLAKFPRIEKGNERIMNIGTAGGFTKASTGYTFQFVQKNTKEIIANLKGKGSPQSKMSRRDKMFSWYDRTLLDVMIADKVQGEEIFSILFKKLPPEKILAFLGNESTFGNELKIMWAVPIWPFLKSGLKQFRS